VALACRGRPAHESLLEGRNRNVRGLNDVVDQEERLANLISDRISPRLVAELEMLPRWQKQVLAQRVYPSPSRPHHLIREGPAAGIDVRLGSTNCPPMSSRLRRSPAAGLGVAVREARVGT
jgi:hypothetical protein